MPIVRTVRGTCADSRGQLLQQRLGLLQNRRAETLGEPAIDWRERVTRLSALALVAPQPGKAGGGAQFECFRSLTLRDCQSAMITFLGGSSVASGVQKIAAHPKHVDLPVSMPHRINDLRRLV